jgi:DNA polymerase-3 subunit delta
MGARIQHQPWIHFFAGSDHAKVQQSSQRFFQSLKVEDPMNVEIIDGRVLSKGAEEVMEVIRKTRESVVTRPFFGGEKVVWLKNVNFLDDSPLGRYESVQGALEAFIQFISKLEIAGVTLIISALGVDKRRSAYKQLSKCARTEVYDELDLRKLDRSEVHRMIMSVLQELNLKAEEEVCEYLFMALGVDGHALRSNAEKLRLYLGENRDEVTLEDARQVVMGQREAVVWDFCNAVLSGHQGKALDLLRQLLLQNESDIGILIILSQQVRIVTLSAALIENKLMRLVPRGEFPQAVLDPKAEDYLPRKKSGEAISSFQLGLAARYASRKSLRSWVEALEKLYQTHYRMLRGLVDKEEALQLLVIELCA